MDSSFLADYWISCNYTTALLGQDGWQHHHGWQISSLDATLIPFIWCIRIPQKFQLQLSPKRELGRGTCRVPVPKYPGLKMWGNLHSYHLLGSSIVLLGWLHLWDVAQALLSIFLPCLSLQCWCSL